MNVQTKYFGRVEYDREDVLSFPSGLFGFEEEKSFLLLPFHGSGGDLLCLQSLQTPSLAFVAMNPFSLDPAYAPALSEEDLRQLGVKTSGELGYYVLCVVRDPIGESTVNLKCPVAVNPATRRAAQVILETGGYQMRHRLAGFQNGGDGGSC